MKKLLARKLKTDGNLTGTSAPGQSGSQSGEPSKIPGKNNFLDFFRSRDKSRADSESSAPPPEAAPVRTAKVPSQLPKASGSLIPAETDVRPAESKAAEAQTPVVKKPVIRAAESEPKEKKVVQPFQSRLAPLKEDEEPAKGDMGSAAARDANTGRATTTNRPIPRSAWAPRQLWSVMDRGLFTNFGQDRVRLQMEKAERRGAQYPASQVAQGGRQLMIDGGSPKDYAERLGSYADEVLKWMNELHTSGILASKGKLSKDDGLSVDGALKGIGGILPLYADHSQWEETDEVMEKFYALVEKGSPPIQAHAYLGLTHFHACLMSTGEAPEQYVKRFSGLAQQLLESLDILKPDDALIRAGGMLPMLVHESQWDKVPKLVPKLKELMKKGFAGGKSPCLLRAGPLPQHRPSLGRA